MAISAELFEAYLKCPTKCWLYFHGEEGNRNIYSEWVRKKNETFRTNGIKLLTDGTQKSEYIIATDRPVNLETASWRLAIDFPVRNKELNSRLHAVERIPSESRDKPCRYLPIRLIVSNKLTKLDKLLIAFDALLLAESQKYEISHGKIVYGDDFSTLKVKTSALTAEVRKVTGKIASFRMNNSPPNLVLNRHCAECEYQYRCHKKATETDDLSLLNSMSEKERKKLNSKGIFTVTQLSYTFNVSFAIFCQEKSLARSKPFSLLSLP